MPIDKISTTSVKFNYLRSNFGDFTEMGRGQIQNIHFVNCKSAVKSTINATFHCLMLAKGFLTGLLLFPSPLNACMIISNPTEDRIVKDGFCI